MRKGRLLDMTAFFSAEFINQPNKWVYTDRVKENIENEL